MAGRTYEKRITEKAITSTKMSIRDVPNRWFWFEAFEPPAIPH